MDNKKDNLADLMMKYHDEKITTDEFKELNQQINSSSDAFLHDILLSHWNSYEEKESLSSTKRVALYKQIQSRIHRPFRSSFQHYWMQIAASFFFILLGAWSLTLYHENEQIKELVSQNVTFTSGKIGKSEITLPDGTRVLLNAQSKLTYQQNFGYDNREVTLSGEGLFKVTHDAEKKFIVKTGFMDVTVLGTTFNVNAYEKNDIVEMALVEGNVKVNSVRDTNTFLFVKPNQKVICNKKSGKLQLEKCSADAEIRWTKNEIIFQNETLQDVFYNLERRFNVRIHLDRKSVV